MPSSVVTAQQPSFLTGFLFCRGGGVGAKKPLNPSSRPSTEASFTRALRGTKPLELLRGGLLC